jgi:hypothetical protein
VNRPNVTIERAHVFDKTGSLDPKISAADCSEALIFVAREHSSRHNNNANHSIQQIVDHLHRRCDETVLALLRMRATIEMQASKPAGPVNVYVSERRKPA